MSDSSRRRAADREESVGRGDVEAAPMQAMQIATGADAGAATSESPSFILLQKLFTKGGFALVLLTVIVVGTIYLFPMAETGPAPVHGDRPTALGSLLRTVSSAAVASGALVPLSVSEPVVLQQDGMKFYVSQPTGAPKPHGNGSVKDVFAADQLEVALVVAPVPPHHTLVLNKYSTFEGHALLITNGFEAQGDLLSLHDVEAWYWALGAAQAAGFYNSGPAAGASQPHKHMQLIPLESFAAARRRAGPSDEAAMHALPIDDAVAAHLAQSSSAQELGGWQPFDPYAAGPDSQLHRLRQFRFQHGFLALLSEDKWAQRATGRDKVYSHSDYLYTAYLYALRMLGITGECSPSFPGQGADNQACAQYNMILTNRWMLIVPRNKAAVEGVVDINGFGFIGFMLSRDIEEIRTEGPLSVLASVGYAGSGRSRG